LQYAEQKMGVCIGCGRTVEEVTKMA